MILFGRSAFAEGVSALPVSVTGKPPTGSVEAITAAMALEEAERTAWLHSFALELNQGKGLANMTIPRYRTARLARRDFGTFDWLTSATMKRQAVIKHAIVR